MKTSTNISNLSKALLKAQTQMGAAKKDSKNPFFKSTYADLPTVMEVVKAPLNDAGIVVLQPATNRDGKNFITTTLVHADSGEWMESETEVVTAKLNDPQAFGAAQTYARRFGLQAMLFIPAEDDDGNYASGRVTSTVTTKPVQTTGTLRTKGNEPVVPANPNAEFDAIPAPAKVESNTSDQSNNSTSLEPLKKSSFRKNTTKQATNSTTSNSTTDEGWN